MKGFGHAPVIGTWLLARSTRKLAESAVQGGDAGAVRELVVLFLSSPAKTVRDIAGSALSSLHEKRAVDTFCREVMIRDDPQLTRISQECRYAPSTETARALFFFVTGKLDLLTLLDPLPAHPLLAGGYAGADWQEKMACLNAAQKNHTCPVLADTLLGNVTGEQPQPWSTVEWAVVVLGLAEKFRWNELWRLLFSAPQPIAVSALHCLRASGWVPDGDERTIFTTLLDTLPETWSFPAPEKQPFLTLERHTSQTSLLTFSPYGNLLVTSGTDGQCRMWSTKSGTLLYTRQAGTGAARSIVFTPDGRLLVCADHDGILWCWDSGTGNLLWDTRGRTDRTACMARTPDSVAVISGGTDGIIRIMDPATGHITATLDCHQSAISCMAISPDGRRLANADSAGRICIHLLNDPVITQEFPVKPKDPRFLQFTPDGNRLVMVGSGIAPLILDIPTSTSLPCAERYDRSAISCTVSSFDKGLAIGSTDGTCSIWHLSSGTLTTVPVYRQGISSSTTTPNGSLLVIGCNNGTIRLFTLPQGEPEREFAAHTGPVITCVSSPDGTTLASCGWGDTVKLWELPSGEPLHTLRVRAGDVTCLCSTPDGSTVITGMDGTCRFFDTQNGSCIRTLDMYTSSVKALAISPDGTCIACAGSDNSLCLWRIADGVRLFACEGLSSTIRSITFTYDGTTLVSGGWDGKVRFWNLADGTLLHTLEGHAGIVTLCATSRFNSSVVTVGSDSTVQLSDPVDGRSMARFNCGKHMVSACALSPDGRILVIGEKTGAVSLVHLPTGYPIASFATIPAKVTALAITRDQQVLIAGYETGILALFSRANNKLIGSFQAHTGAIIALTPCSGEDRVVTSGCDGATRVWSLPFTCPLGKTTLADLSRVSDYIRVHPSDPALTRWQFFEHLLQARFRHEIELCIQQPVAGAYDIQIVG